MLDITIDQIDPTVLFAGSWQNTRCRKESDQKYTYTYRMLSLMREKATLSLDMAYCSAFSPAITNILQMSEAFRNPPSGKENSRHGSNISTFWATNQSAWNTNARELFEKLS